MNNPQDINIIFSGNRAVFKGMLLCSLSIIKHHKGPVNFYLLTADLTHLNDKFSPVNESDRQILEDEVKKVNANSRAILVDASKIFVDYLSNNKNTRSVYTPYSYLRLILDKVDNIPNTILYLDIDIMVNDDIAKLFEIDISNYEYGAVLDHVGSKWISRKYINSGVLYLNMKKIKQTGLFPKTRNYMNKRKLFMPDQTALNVCVKDKLILDRKFNEQRDIKSDTVIKHFCKRYRAWPPRLENIKQWQFDDVHKKLKINEFDDIFEYFISLEKKYNTKF